LVYPPLLVAMVLYPYVIALFIDPGLVSGHELLILAAWLPVCTIPAILLKYKAAFRLITVLCFIESFIDLSHWLILKGPFTVTSFFVLLNTNYHESVEFMQLKAGWSLLCLLPHIALFILALKYVPHKIETVPGKLMLSVFAVFSVVFIWENASHNRLIRKGVPQVARTFVSYSEEMKMFGAIKNRQAVPVKITATRDLGSEQVFVLIIGESCNRNHMSLYGYKHKTNPKLEARNDISVYKDVISAYSFTLKAVLSMITESNIEAPMPIDQSTSLIDVFQSAKYQTYWISNQAPLGIWDNAVSNMAGSANVVRFVNIVSNSSEDAIYTPSYDGKLFEPFQHALQTKDRRKFIVLHLMGNHSYYSRRYPAEFSVFHSGTTPQEIEINEYDNAILYNDFVVDSLLNIVSAYTVHHPKAACSVIYLSDHGENVYDEYGYAGHEYANVLPNANIEIPFVVWLSPQFKRAHPELSDRVAENCSKPFMSDDLFHSVLSLNGIECAQLTEERSLFAPSYNTARIRTPENKGPYVRK
jgi:heptose-I-phosphate ethanolaminephosphotransferase